MLLMHNDEVLPHDAEPLKCIIFINQNDLQCHSDYYSNLPTINTHNEETESVSEPENVYSCDSLQKKTSLHDHYKTNFVK